MLTGIKKGENPLIEKDEKIIIDRKIILKASSNILNSLNCIGLLKAYLDLNELCRSKITEVAMTVYDEKPIDPNSILEEYRLHLEASAKSKNTIKDYSREIERFLSHLKESGTSFTNINTNFLNVYLFDQKTKRVLSTNSYSRLVIVIRSFLCYLYKENIISSPLALELKAPRRVDKERECLTKNEIQKILNYLDSKKERYKGENVRDKLIFLLGINCGLRKSEIAKLNWEEVNLTERRIKILDAKGGKERIVYYNQELGNVIEDYREISGNCSRALVRGSFGKRITSCPMYRIVRRMYIKSGIYRKGLTVHSLRHTFAENLRKKEVDLKVIKTLLGHSSLATTDRYLHVSSEDLKEAAI